MDELSGRFELVDEEAQRTLYGGTANDKQSPGEWSDPVVSPYSPDQIDRMLNGDYGVTSFSSSGNDSGNGSDDDDYFYWGGVLDEVTISAYGGVCCPTHQIYYYKKNGNCPKCNEYDIDKQFYDAKYGESGNSNDNGNTGNPSGNTGVIGGGGHNPGNPLNPTGSVLPNRELMDESKFVSQETTKNCWEASRKILGNYNLTETGSSANVYQLYMEDKSGNLCRYGTDPDTTFLNAIACINRHLDASRPIIVGINHSKNYGINEGTTDHFLVITGRGYDSSKGMYYYTYMETGRSSGNQGCNTTENRFYYNEQNKTLIDENTYRSEGHKLITVTQVRPNDGLYYDQTTRQPDRPKY